MISALTNNSSQYSVSLPAWLTATKNVRGLHQIEVSSSRENGQDLEGFVYDNTHYVDTYRAVDLPAMKREPMLYCSRQFLDAVSYEITAMNVPGHFINFSRSWKDVAEAVHNSKVYEVMHAPSQFKSDVSAIRSKDADDLTKLSEIVALVRKNVQWDNRIDLIPSGQSSVIKDHSGTSSDINALIGSAAIAAGYKVSPVLIRLRTSGPIMGPSLSAFDTFILHITAADGKDYFLDGADPSGYFNVLPELYLVDRGFEVSDTKGEFNWVNLTSLLKNSTSYLVMAAVSPDGNLSGTLNGKFSNVSSLDFKDAFRGLKDEEELYEKMGKTVLADLSELKVTGLDEFTSQSNLSVKFEKACDVAGNLLVVNPFIVPLLSDAAFKGEDRKLPVEFPYPESTSYIFRVSIPEGYVVDQLPSNGRLSSQLPANMTIMSMSDGTAVTVQFKFDNKALISMPNAYSEVRKFWTDVCAVFDGRIIFKKAE